MRHNHSTQTTQPLGSCPACDHHHARQAVTSALVKLQSCCLDSDADFRRVATSMTRVMIGLITLDRQSRA